MRLCRRETDRQQYPRPLRSLSSLLLLFSLFLLLPAARAATLRVKADAPGPTHDGTSWQAAFTAIPDALAAAASGDEVWVAAGTYAGGITLKPGVALYGGFTGTEADRAERDPKANATVLDGALTQTVLSLTVSGPATVVDGFSIRNGGDAGVYCATGSVALVNDTISGGKGAGVAADFGAQVSISGCIIHGNAGIGLGASQSDVIIANSIIDKNGTGISCDMLSTAQVVNVTIVGNTEAGAAAYEYSSIVLTNDIIANNGTGVLNDADQPGLFALNNNDVFGNTTGYSGLSDATGSRGNIAQDPLFVNRDGGDYHVQPSSPTIDAGDDTAVPANSVDLEGRPRIQGPHVDQGAYEYAATAALVFTTQPAGGAAGGPFTTQPVVTVKDASGSVVTSYNSPITISIQSGPAGAALSGTTTVNAVNGVATFSGLGLNKGGTNYVLQVGGRGLVSGFSDVFVVQSQYVRVSPAGNDANDGSTWNVPKKTVQAALKQALPSGGEVWVATGTYTGNFLVPSGVGVYGGFIGMEASRSQRDIVKNPTTLQATDGSVVTIASGAVNTTTVDGFTIAGGTGTRVEGTPAIVYGGGIVCMNGAPAIRNNTISGNVTWTEGTASYGGGIYCKGTGWVIENNAVNANTAQYGGGIYAEGGGSLKGNTVTANTAKDRGEPADSAGGGIACLGLAINVDGNTLLQNAAGTGGGGGLWANATSLVVTNNTVGANTAAVGQGGAGMALSGGGTVSGNSVTNNDSLSDGGGIAYARNFTLSSNVVAGNQAANAGGGIFARGATGNILNNTVVSNTAATGGGIAGGAVFANNIVAYNSSGVSATGAFRNNDVYGNVAYDYATTDYTGMNGNVRIEPYFANRADADYHLRVYSPLIDAGYDAVVKAGDTDRDGTPRIVGAHVDLGAYEYPVSVTPGTVPVTFLSMHSVGSDWVGGGGSYLFTDKDTSITVSAGDATKDGIPDSVSFVVNQGNYAHWFYPDFNTYHVPTNLVPGFYDNAQRAPFAEAGHPGIDIGGDGRGCNTICGKFTVLDAVYQKVGDQFKVVSFAASFEQHCECGTGYLQGVIAYNSTAVQAPYVMEDVTRAMAMVAGILPVTPSDLTRLNVEKSGASAAVVDIRDVERIIRKVLGREFNP